MGHLEEHAVLALAVISCVLASGAAFMTARNSTRQPTTAATTTTALNLSEKTLSKEKNDDQSGSDADLDDEKESPKDDKADIIDEAYKLIHQRYNRKDYKWEDFDPLKDAKTHDGVIFIVYHRHMEPNAVRPLERLVEVHSESLKDVLRACLKHVDTVFDPKPMVHVWKPPLTKVDAQKLFTHEAQLQTELAKLRGQLKVAEEKEAKQPSTENKDGSVDEKKESTDDPKDSVSDSSPNKPSLFQVKALLNGDSTESDSTAVNTPDRSATPKVDTETGLEGNSRTDSEVEISADVLRLRVLHLEKLLNFLNTEFAPTRQKLNDLLVNGDIKFGLLWCLFRLGSVISLKDYESGLVMAGEVHSS